MDTAWKKVLAESIDDAIDFFLPELAKDRDTSREIELQWGEFPAIGAEGDIGRRTADLTCIVPIKGGRSREVGLFLEAQDEDDLGIALRMFQTFYRMSDRLNKQVTALAIFTGRAKDRSEYLYSCYGVNLSFKYNTYHVGSQDIDELKSDKRVFATVVLAARMVIAAKGNPLSREKYVRELLKILRERDYDIERRKRIMDFISSVMKMKSQDISEELRREFEMEWLPLSEVRKRIAIEDAKEEGKMEVAGNLLKKGVSIDIIVESTGLDREDILALG